MLEQKVPVEFVLADRQCKGLAIAAKAGIPCTVLSRSFDSTFNREAFTDVVIHLFREHHIDLVAMAGFMTVFSPAMFAPDAYQLKVLNTHPALLPAFKGHSAVKDALAYGVKVTGCTIHVATEKLDDGPILAQEAVKVMPGDTVESLHERIKAVERELYPKLLHELVS
jgi:phosphoribosylglycinamide formyltransferase-1